MMTRTNGNIRTILEKLPIYFIYCFIGTTATVYVQRIGYNAIVASSIVGIIVAFYTIIINDDNHYSWAAFCGSFAGMIFINNISRVSSSAGFFCNTLILATITSLCYILIELFTFKFPRQFFDGYGGKLGTTAFISVLIFILIKNSFFGTDIRVVSDTFDFKWHYLLIIVSTLAGSLISMEIKTTVSSLNENYKVLTVATTGMIGGLLVTKIEIFGQFFGFELAAAWYTGAFVGMSSYFILMMKRDYVITGIISGVLFILSRHIFNGFGGKLGFISFLSVLIMRLAYYISHAIKYSHERRPEDLIESIQSGEKIDNHSVDDEYAQKLVESLIKAREAEGNEDE